MAILSASILSADFGQLEAEARSVLEAGADWIHVDVMDGHFVPNITIGLPVVRALSAICRDVGAQLDVHLMIADPDRYVSDFVAAGADILTVHVEACRHLHRTLEQIRGEGALAGVALNPGTPLVAIEEVLSEIDLALVMSVNPGFASQSFIPQTTGKVARLKRVLNAAGAHIHLEVDGGVKPGNVGAVVEAGANVIVAASAIFDVDVTKGVAALRRGMATSVQI